MGDSLKALQLADSGPAISTGAVGANGGTSGAGATSMVPRAVEQPAVQAVVRPVVQPFVQPFVQPAVQPVAQPAELAGSASVRHVGRYDVLRQLAEGSWGPIYAALDPVAQMQTALRVVTLNLPEHARPTVDSLFMTALRPVAALRHAHIASTFEVGVVAEGIYIAGEWLQGRSLAEVLRLGWQASPAQAASLVRQVMAALAHAHASGVVHGGVAPACVWLDKSGQVRLQGFALALAAQASQLPDLDPLVVGPGHYVAPEQLSGYAVGAATDVHGAGVLLYELLTGQKTFPGHTVPEVVSALLKYAPVAPHLLRPDVPKALSEIVMRAIQREPAARYPTAEAMAQALQGWLRQVSGAEPADLAGWGFPRRAADVSQTSTRAPALAQASTHALASHAVSEPVVAKTTDQNLPVDVQPATGAGGGTRHRRSDLRPGAGQPAQSPSPGAGTSNSDTQFDPDSVDTADAPAILPRSAQWQPPAVGSSRLRWLLGAAALCGAAALLIALSQ